MMNQIKALAVCAMLAFVLAAADKPAEIKPIPADLRAELAEAIAQDEEAQKDSLAAMAEIKERLYNSPEYQQMAARTRAAAVARSGELLSPSAISASSCRSAKPCHQPSVGQAPSASPKLVDDSNAAAAAGTGFGPRSGTVAQPETRPKIAAEGKIDKACRPTILAGIMRQ